MGPMGASVSFDEIKDSFLAIERDFKKLAKGAKDVCAQEFFKFQKVRIYVKIKNFTQWINLASVTHFMVMNFSMNYSSSAYEI